MSIPGPCVSLFCLCKIDTGRAVAGHNGEISLALVTTKKKAPVCAVIPYIRHKSVGFDVFFVVLTFHLPSNLFAARGEDHKKP